jgi:hypothetical protein
MIDSFATTGDATMAIGGGGAGHQSAHGTCRSSGRFDERHVPDRLGGGVASCETAFKANDRGHIGPRRMGPTQRDAMARKLSHHRLLHSRYSDVGIIASDLVGVAPNRSRYDPLNSIFVLY